MTKTQSEVENFLEPLTLRRLGREISTVFLPLAEIRVDCPTAPCHRASYEQICEQHPGREGVPRCLKDLIQGCHHPYFLAGVAEYVQAKHMKTLGLIEEPESFA
jgi:hypothetical protein